MVVVSVAMDREPAEYRNINSSGVLSLPTPEPTLSIETRVVSGSYSRTMDRGGIDGTRAHTLTFAMMLLLGDLVAEGGHSKDSCMPYRIGDGQCHSSHNTKACGWFCGLNERKRGYQIRSRLLFTTNNVFPDCF